MITPVPQELRVYRDPTEEQIRSWHVWIDGQCYRCDQDDRLENLFNFGRPTWAARMTATGDYPLYRLTKEIVSEFKVETFKDLQKIPFEVWWPQ